jgi:ribosome maturation factor RimP
MADPEQQTQQTIGKIWQLVEPVIQAEGLELVEVEYRREPPGWVLRLFIDQEGGVGIDDCTRVNRVIGDLLDVADPIHHPYHLEVSSPGLDRPLRKWQHFAREVGNVVQVVAKDPINNRKKFKGVLRTAQPETITLDCDGQTFSIPLAQVDRARLRFFDSEALHG